MSCIQWHVARGKLVIDVINGSRRIISFSPGIVIVNRLDLNDSTEPIRKAFGWKVGVMLEHKQKKTYNQFFFSNRNDSMSRKSIINVKLIITSSESNYKTNVHKIQCIQLKQPMFQNLYWKHTLTFFLSVRKLCVRCGRLGTLEWRLKWFCEPVRWMNRLKESMLKKEPDFTKATTTL